MPEVLVHSLLPYWRTSMMIGPLLSTPGSQVCGLGSRTTCVLPAGLAL